MKIIYSDTVLGDMKAAKAYLCENHPSLASLIWDGLLKRLEKSVKLLEEINNLGTEYKNYRRLNFDIHTLYYQVNKEKDVIEIMRFLHGKLDIASRLSEE